MDGQIWRGVRAVEELEAPSGPVRRVLRLRRGEEIWTERHADRVEIVEGLQRDPAAADLLHYWRCAVVNLDTPSGNEPIQRAYGAPSYAWFDFVDPRSAFGSYLSGTPVTPVEFAGEPLFPFRCNRSQRLAVEKALGHSVSVIEGPPGTGKTETILNLVASIVGSGAATVAVVSAQNAAVDNVREKLISHGFGHMIANLGNKERRRDFFASQDVRAADVERFLSHEHERVAPQYLADTAARLRRAQAGVLQRARLQMDIDAYAVERRHFDEHVSRGLPGLGDLPLLRRSSRRIIDFLVETQSDLGAAPAGLLRRLHRYFRYGSLQGLDPGDVDTVLRLQRAFYDKRVAELRLEISAIESGLEQKDFENLVAEYRDLCRQELSAVLADRYRGSPREIYDFDRYRYGATFDRFMTDYPVLLSSCQSLQGSLQEGFLLDYLIIDEASQVDLLNAGLAMSSARNLVVVGDPRQLEPVRQRLPAMAAPAPAYDQARHSILTSLAALHGDDLPVTLLNEHYRCHPTIIGFCNKAFYDGALVPHTIGASEDSMTVVTTSPGNHMRRHREGGRSNQREIDVIALEVTRQECADVSPADIAVTTPYNLQVRKAVEALGEGAETSTIHKFQGREKRVVILTTVLDDSWRGRTGLPFVDDPKMINVAVSRAVERFILVTNHEQMPASRYLRDLIGYIRYHRGEKAVRGSGVVSIFDLLYRSYDESLRGLSERRRGLLRYPSEDIAWTVIQDVLAAAPHAHLTAVHQVLLRNLLPDLNGLTQEQQRYVRNRASVDFVVYNRISNQPWLVIEVDGFAYHEDDPRQRERDRLKDDILRHYRMPLLRLPTTGSGEQERIREALSYAEAHWFQATAITQSGTAAPD